MLNLFLVHSYMPDRFMDATIVPLVKCKGKDLADISNYRAITLSNSITKVFEFVFLDHINDKMSTIDSRFGFKAGLYTSLCSFKQTADYYTGKKSHVLCVLPTLVRHLME